MDLKDIELFILALVRSGLGTVYDLKVKAGLSVGSTGPVLERLAKVRLVELDRLKTRNTRRFAITRAGVKTLQSRWESLLDQRPTDFEAVLRITYLAWTLGGRDAAMNFAEACSSTLKDLAGTRRSEAKQLFGTMTGEGKGSSFRWLRTFCDASRLDAQADALGQALAELQKKKNKKGK